MSFRPPLLFALSLCASAVTAPNAQVVVDPGTTSPSLQATDCAHASRGLGGGECTVDCDYECTLSENRAQAWMDVESFDIGKRYITTTVYTEFTVSSDASSAGNTVAGTLMYDVEWLGWWYFVTAIVNYEPHVSMKMWMTDRTSGQPTVSETFHDVDASTFLSIEIIEAGVGRDKGSTVGESHVNLIRGHTYRAHLTISLEAIAYSAGQLKLDYLGSSSGVWWNDLKIKIAPDLAERIDALEERVDSLEAANERLREDLENHTHTYLTGRGEGHNNTVAETSPAIIMDPEPVDEGELGWLEDSTRASDPLPVPSVALSNYPNPFNPTTKIEYTIPEPAHTSIVIYNTLGQVVRTIVDEYTAAGTHTIDFEAHDLASGVYYYRLTSGKYTETRKLTLIK